MGNEGTATLLAETLKFGAGDFLCVAIALHLFCSKSAAALPHANAVRAVEVPLRKDIVGEACSACP